MTKVLKIAIVSDIHAFGDREYSAGALPDYTNTSPPAQNPLVDLIHEVNQSQITADVLVCAGDISNRADPSGLRHAWADLQRLARELGNAQLIATNGNHDLDSRYLKNATDPDPKFALQELDPLFPFTDPIITNQYWAQNFAVITHVSGAVFAVLNTSAYHGGKKEEMDYGRVSKKTIGDLQRELRRTRGAKAHILVCHHHPLPLAGWDDRDDTEYIRNGTSLLNALSEATASSWLVIHGHRHLPELFHGVTNNGHIPFVFASGSLGARVPGIPNQFHLMTLCEPPVSEHAPIGGLIESWLWTDTGGWTSNGSEDGMPARCGFGYTGQIKRLAESITVICRSNGFQTWEEILEKLPAVGFLIPRAFKELEDSLEQVGISILRDRYGKIVQIGK